MKQVYCDECRHFVDGGDPKCAVTFCEVDGSVRRSESLRAYTSCSVAHDVVPPGLLCVEERAKDTRGLSCNRYEPAPGFEDPKRVGWFERVARRFWLRAFSEDDAA